MTIRVYIDNLPTTLVPEVQNKRHTVVRILLNAATKDTPDVKKEEWFTQR